MTLKKVEQVQREIVGLMQREVWHSVVDAHEDPPNDQLLGVRVVDVCGAIRRIAFARPENNLVRILQQYCQNVKAEL